MIRPELQAKFWAAREVIIAGLVALLGLWFALRGGIIPLLLGGTLALVAGWFALLAIRRLRFGQDIAAPGIVEVDEAQISYFGPDGGGFVSVRELSELRLSHAAGRRFWRLKQADGQALLIPVDAQGTASLFDTFAALPGMDSQALIAALDGHGPASAQKGLTIGHGAATIGPVIWRRPALLALT
jgi:hypothetical protein